MTGVIGGEGDVEITILRFLKRPSEESVRMKRVDRNDYIQENG